MDERKLKQRRKKVEVKQVTLLNGRPKSETKVEDNGESEEASAGIESDGRRKEIAGINNKSQLNS